MEGAFLTPSLTHVEEEVSTLLTERRGVVETPKTRHSIERVEECHGGLHYFKPDSSETVFPGRPVHI